MSNPFATAESSGSSSEPLQPMAFSQAGMPGGTAMPGLAGGASSAQKASSSHIAFKTAALFTYLFLSGVMSYTNTFVIVVILSALDFWTVKNVSGRLLVGLRWSNTIGEDGHPHGTFRASRISARYIRWTRTSSGSVCCATSSRVLLLPAFSHLVHLLCVCLHVQPSQLNPSLFPIPSSPRRNIRAAGGVDASRHRLPPDISLHVAPPRPRGPRTQRY